MEQQLKTAGDISVTVGTVLSIIVDFVTGAVAVLAFIWWLIRFYEKFTGKSITKLFKEWREARRGRKN